MNVNFLNVSMNHRLSWNGTKTDSSRDIRHIYFLCLRFEANLIDSLSSTLNNPKSKIEELEKFSNRSRASTLNEVARRGRGGGSVKSDSFELLHANTKLATNLRTT